MILTIISDTHNKHKHITGDLKGGDLLIHAGDLSSMGYEHEITEFAKWYNGLENYDHKVFIAGNHDWGFQNNSEKIKGLLTGYKNIDYLEDDWITVGDGDPHDNNTQTAKIWGSPWQPEFYNWAFNLPRNGWELETKWNDIPNDTDVLITHGPPYGVLDFVQNGRKRGLEFVGCEQLMFRVERLKPLLHEIGRAHV